MFQTPFSRRDRGSGLPSPFGCRSASRFPRISHIPDPRSRAETGGLDSGFRLAVGPLLSTLDTLLATHRP